MALMASAAYTSTTREVRLGDRLLLYTDGIVEATNSQDEEFGYERVIAVLRESATSAPEQVVDALLGTESAWSERQQDDLTLLLCEYRGASRAATS